MQLTKINNYNFKIHKENEYFKENLEDTFDNKNKDLLDYLIPENSEKHKKISNNLIKKKTRFLK